jgi:hypothetical protein
MLFSVVPKCPVRLSAMQGHIMYVKHIILEKEIVGTGNRLAGIKIEAELGKEPFMTVPHASSISLASDDLEKVVRARNWCKYLFHAEGRDTIITFFFGKKRLIKEIQVS